MRGVTLKLGRLCVYVIINKCSFEFMRLDPVIYHQNLQNDEKVINQRLSKPCVKMMKAFVMHRQRETWDTSFVFCELPGRNFLCTCHCFMRTYQRKSPHIVSTFVIGDEEQNLNRVEIAFQTFHLVHRKFKNVELLGK